MNALMLNCLENKDRAKLEESHTFEVHSWDDLSAGFHDRVSRPYARRSRYLNAFGISL